MDWALKNPKRLLYERAQIEELAKEGWIKGIVWRLTRGLAVEVDIDMEIHGTDYPVTLTYTDLFPETAAYIRPRDHLQHWSGHQHGPGGTLCLEWREDNWHPDVTGADLLRSTYKLLSTERHPEQPGRVPSAHRQTEGQELRRSESYRVVLTSGALSSFTALASPGSMRLQTAMVFHSGPSVTFVSQVEGADGSMVATADLPPGLTSHGSLFALAHDGHAFKHESFDAVAANGSPAELEDTLRSAGFQKDFLTACKNSPKYRHHLVLLIGAKKIRAYGVSGGEEPALHEYGLVMPHDAAQRLPSEHAKLAPLRIGIVGLGSLGSKIAVSLARSGLRKFLLVDDDVLLPENICRHESSWAVVGLHKVQALQEELSLIAANMEVEVYMHRVGGQESAMRAARVLKDLCFMRSADRCHSGSCRISSPGCGCEGTPRAAMLG